MGKIKTFACRVKNVITSHPVIAGLVVLTVVGLPAIGIAATVLAGSCSQDELDMAGVELGYNHE